MLNLPQKTLNHIKRFLQRQKRQVEGNIKAVEDDDPATPPALAESTEPGTESWIADEHGRIVVISKQLQQLSLGIRKSLVKIKAGTYGHCEECKKHIETSRLLVMPTAAYCLSCSRKGSK